MSTKKNLHGLSRDIPQDIRRRIRENSGFGCVICGSGITAYEHVIPEFKDAKSHDPDKMTLLCGSCHDNVTRGVWSKEKVLKAMEAPKAKEQGYSNGFFDLGNEHPTIIFAGSTVKKTFIPIQISNIPLIEIKPPETNSPFFRLSASFFDSKGENTLTIKDNEWISSSDCWDIKFEGKSMTIREAHGKMALVLTVQPPNCIIIERISMLIPNKYFVEGNKEILRLMSPDQTKVLTEFRNCVVDNCYIGFNIN